MNNYIYNQIYSLQEIGNFSLMVSDFEELVGVTHSRRWG